MALAMTRHLHSSFVALYSLLIRRLSYAIFSNLQPLMTPLEPLTCHKKLNSNSKDKYKLLQTKSLGELRQTFNVARDIFLPFQIKS